MTTGRRNPVAKHAPEFCKPKTFRDRKKEAKKEGDYQEHPKHRPYHRDRESLNHLLIEDEWEQELLDLDVLENE